MEIKPPHFYHAKRLEKKQKRKIRAIRKTTVFAIAVLVSLFVYFITTSSVKEIVANKKQPTKILEKKSVKKYTIVSTNGNIKIYMPFNNRNFTGIGYHSAFNNLALDFNPVGKKVRTKEMPKSKAKKTLRNTKNPAYLKLLRSGRNGRWKSAIDIGAKAGSIIRSPIDGKVAFVRKYRLYGSIDYEIHIFPRSYKDRHLVIIHVSNPMVKKGDIVEKSLTSIGRVRKISDSITPQLSDYTKDEGNHIHIQMNKIGKNGKCSDVQNNN